MSQIRLPIDVKSLHYNIKNDNKTGHTATVATPLKQGASVHEKLARIKDIPENISFYSREALISQILSNSRALARIIGVYVFNNLSINGEKLDTEYSFCMYIREETDPKNVHFGRQKVHYPLSLYYEDNETCIYNKQVIKSISEHLQGYAFIVEAFEYDMETSVLNFDVTIVGENNIPYSKVFINKRGVGNKFTSNFTESSDIYDTEIIALREIYGYDLVSPDNFNEYIEKNNKEAMEIVLDYINSLGAKNIRSLRDEYPYALYDIQYTLNDVRMYAIVKQTATRTKYFGLSTSKIRFCNDFSDHALVFLVTDIKGNPKIQHYAINDLNKLNKTINSITYEDRK